jgi:putative transposase
MDDTPQRDSRGANSTDFQRLVGSFLSQPGLPFAEVLSAERIARVFARHGNLFGVGQVYSTVVMLWSFLGQVLRDGKEAACQAAVARVVTHCLARGLPPPTDDTGDYCRARAKLSEPALRDIGREIAAEVEQRADPGWLWLGRHAKLADGFTLTMPDTPANQREYPAPASQTPGVGLPIARAVAVISLATACVLDVASGPYAGKKTGETARLRDLLGAFDPGDVAVMDRYYCSFLMIALFSARGVDVCARMHQKRHVDFRRGQRLGRNDHLIVWIRPVRPAWMDQATYDTIPETLTLREMRLRITRPGCRTRTLTLATTLVDATTYTLEDVARLYNYRWHAELDLRSIKQSLNLNHVRCKTPAMVRKEIRTTILAYNLIRTTAAAAALRHGRLPRRISFTATCQHVLAHWMTIACETPDAARSLERCELLLKRIAESQVGHRPGRVEPRVIKRRRDHYPHMRQPRATLRARLQKR